MNEIYLESQNRSNHLKALIVYSFFELWFSPEKSNNMEARELSMVEKEAILKLGKKGKSQPMHNHWV